MAPTDSRSKTSLRTTTKRKSIMVGSIPTSTRLLRRDSSKKVSGTDGPTSTALLAGVLERSKLGLNGKPGILTTTGERTAVFEDCLTGSVETLFIRHKLE